MWNRSMKTGKEYSGLLKQTLCKSGTDMWEYWSIYILIFHYFLGQLGIADPANFDPFKCYMEDVANFGKMFIVWSMLDCFTLFTIY